MSSLRDLPGVCPVQYQSQALAPCTAGAEHHPACADAQQTVPATPPNSSHRAAADARLACPIIVFSTTRPFPACSVCNALERTEENGLDDKGKGALGWQPSSRPLSPPCPQGASRRRCLRVVCCGGCCCARAELTIPAARHEQGSLESSMNWPDS